MIVYNIDFTVVVIMFIGRESSVGSYVTIEHERPERARNSKNTSISLPKQDQGEPSSTQQIPSRTVPILMF